MNWEYICDHFFTRLTPWIIDCHPSGTFSPVINLGTLLTGQWYLFKPAPTKIFQYLKSPLSSKTNVIIKTPNKTIKSSSSFSGNVLKLFLGSVVSQALGVLVAPVVTRIFEPEAFGVAALFISITGIITVVACLRYELSIMLPKTDEEAANLLGLSLCFVLVTTVISALIIFFAGDVIANLLHSPEIRKYLWLIPVSIFTSGIFLTLNYWNSRIKHFGCLSIARVISSVVTQTTKLGIGFAGFVSGGVLIGTSILGQVVSTFILGSQVWRDNGGLFKENIRWKRMIAGLKRYKKFPIYSTSSALLNTVSQQLPVLLLAAYFSPKIVGFYALGRMVLGMPMGLVGKAIGQVFFQKASDAHNSTGNLPEVVEEVFKRLVAIGIFPILLLTLIGKDVFIVAFGTRWAEAGVYMQILCIWSFFVFISSPISTLFAVLEKQSYGLLFNIALFVTRAISLIGGGLIGNARISLVLFSGTGTIAFLVMTFWLLSCVNISPVRTLNIFFKNVIMCIPILSIVILCKFAFNFTPLLMISIGIIGSISYYLIIIKQDRELQKLIRILTKKLGFGK